MGIVAMIGLIFGPFVSLLFAAWFYVRWQNEEDEELALRHGDTNAIAPFVRIEKDREEENAE